MTVLYIPIWIGGTFALENLVPDIPSEPGLVNEVTGIFILSIINVGLIVSFAIKVGLIAVIYLVIYWLAGYFIAW